MSRIGTKQSLANLDEVMSELVARNPAFVAEVAAIAEASMARYWGERCPDFDAECIACQAWASFDRGEPQDVDYA